MLWWWENPCRYGHVFVGTSSTSRYTHEPPGNQRCLCGAFTWEQVRPNTGMKTAAAIALDGGEDCSTRGAAYA